MAVPTLPKLKTIKLTKLQALLLLGGAFVLAAGGWILADYRLVSEPGWGIYGDGSDVITIYGDSAPAKRFMSQLTASSSDTVDLAALSPDSAITFYAKADQPGGDLKIHSSGSFKALGGVYPSQLRLIRKNVQALGYVSINGREQPLSVSFDSEKAVFRVGQTYQGLIGDAPTLNTGRRMRVPLNEEMSYLEKPEGASWNGAASMLGLDLQRFPALSAFWTLPGRVEMSVSASHTDTVLQPFSLYYRPIATLNLPRTMLETCAKDLLADAFPHPIDIQLPDGSHMQELRHDSEGIQAAQQKNQFGDIVKFSYPGQKEALYAFYAKDGEAWLTTDLSLVQKVLLGNIDATTPDDECHRGGSGGFAFVPGSFLPFPSGFKDMTVSIHNLETGLFTICGYY